MWHWKLRGTLLLLLYLIITRFKSHFVFGRSSLNWKPLDIFLESYLIFLAGRLWISNSSTQWSSFATSLTSWWTTSLPVRHSPSKFGGTGTATIETSSGRRRNSRTRRRPAPLHRLQWQKAGRGAVGAGAASERPACCLKRPNLFTKGRCIFLIVPCDLTMLIVIGRANSSTASRAERRHGYEMLATLDCLSHLVRPYTVANNAFTQQKNSTWMLRLWHNSYLTMLSCFYENSERQRQVCYDCRRKRINCKILVSCRIVSVGEWSSYVDILTTGHWRI